MGYSFRLTARVLLYASSHRQDSTYHGLCYTSRGALAGTKIAKWVHPMKDRSDNPSHHERTLLPRSYISLPNILYDEKKNPKTPQQNHKKTHEKTSSSLLRVDLALTAHLQMLSCNSIYYINNYS